MNEGKASSRYVCGDASRASVSKHNFRHRIKQAEYEKAGDRTNKRHVSEQSFDVSHKIPSVSRPFCTNKIKKKNKKKIASDVATLAFFFFSQARYSIVSLLVFLFSSFCVANFLLSNSLLFSSLLFSSLLFSLLSLSNYICSFYKSFYPSTNWHLALWRPLRFFSATGKSYFPSSYSFTINPYTSQISPWKIKKKPISWNLCWLEDKTKRRSWRTSCCRWIGSRPMHHLAWSRLDCLVLRLFLGIWAGSQLEAKKKYKFPS